jgi:hypothetical protein
MIFSSHWEIHVFSLPEPFPNSQINFCGFRKALELKNSRAENKMFFDREIVFLFSCFTGWQFCGQILIAELLPRK